MIQDRSCDFSRRRRLGDPLRVAAGIVGKFPVNEFELLLLGGPTHRVSKYLLEERSARGLPLHEALAGAFGNLILPIIAPAFCICVGGPAGCLLRISATLTKSFVHPARPLGAKTNFLWGPATAWEPSRFAIRPGPLHAPTPGSHHEVEIAHLAKGGVDPRTKR